MSEDASASSASSASSSSEPSDPSKAERLGIPAKEEQEEVETRCKASVYFKFSQGRTRNRTFPGSMDKRGRALILEWARQFRGGDSSSPEREPDERVVHTMAKRCKLATVTRKSAFDWFRMSQEKYALMYLEKEVDAYRFNILPLPPARVVQFKPCVFVPGEGTEYVEITWDNEVQFPEMPEIWGLSFGQTLVAIHALEHGRGAFFNATQIPAGKYTIHNVQFEVQQKPESTSSASSEDGAVAKAALGAAAAIKAHPTKREENKKTRPGVRKRSRDRLSTLKVNNSTGGNGDSDGGKVVGPTAYFVGDDNIEQSTTCSFAAPTSRHGSYPALISGDFQNTMKRRKITRGKRKPKNAGAPRFDGASSLTTGQPSMSASAGFTMGEMDEGASIYWGNSDKFTSQENYLAIRHPATPSEARLIRRMRAELGDLLTKGHIASCIEVVGNWSLLRFLRGANSNLGRAVDLFRMHLDVREEFKWHETRDRVVSSPNFDPLHFTMDDIVFGDFVQEHWKIIPCMGYTKVGDPLAIVLLPVSDAWIDILMSKVNENEPHLFSRGREFFNELFVRRQIQLDALSRQQGKMVCVETIWDFSGGTGNSYWKVFARSDYRRFQGGHNRIVGSLPNIQGRVHVIGASWWVRWSYRCLWWISDALLRRKILLYPASNDEAYRKLCNCIGIESLAVVVEHISKLNAAGIVSSFQLPQNMAAIAQPTRTPPIGAADWQGSSASSADGLLSIGGVTRVPEESEPTKDAIPVQCVVRRGDVKLSSGVSHEVMIEVDPDRASAVLWKFSALSQPLAFTAMFFRMNHDPNDPILKDENVVAPTRLETGEGLIEVQERGCLLLRWTNEKPSALKFWSSCLRSENSVKYEVESVPRNKDDFAASAIGLLMLRSGAQ